MFYWSSHQKCSMQKGALINFTKFTGKHLYQSLFLTKLQAWGRQLYQKRNSGTGAFLWILRNVYKHVISKHLWTTASDFICSVFFIFFIIKNFRHEKSRFVRKKSTSGKPTLHCNDFISRLYVLFQRKESFRGCPKIGPCKI